MRDPAGSFGHALLDTWQLEPGVVYLNHAAFGATPRPVAEAAETWRKQAAANPTAFFERTLGPALRASAETLGGFLGSAGEDIVFVDNVTAGINAVLRSLVVMPGDEIVATNHLYMAARRTLDFVCERAGGRLVLADLPYPARGEQDLMAAILGSLSPRTRLVMLDHVTHETALAIPIEAIAARCAERGIPVMIDGTHGPGNVPVDLDGLGEAGVGWYAGSCHTWLGTPPGCGFLWTHPDRQALVRPTAISTRFGEGYTEAFDWPGPKDFSPWLAIGDALAMRKDYGDDIVRAHTHGLAREAAQMLSDRWGTPAGAPPSMTTAMVAVALPVETPATVSAAHTLRQALQQDYKIEVQVSPFNGRLWARISAYLYNEIGDYEKLAEAVPAVLRSDPLAANA